MPVERTATGYRLLDAAGSEVPLINDFLAYAVNRQLSMHTVRAYAYDLQYLLRFSEKSQILLNEFEPGHATSYLDYLVNHSTKVARKRAEGADAEEWNRHPARLSAASTRRAINSARSFFDFLIVSQLYFNSNPFRAEARRPPREEADEAWARLGQRPQGRAALNVKVAKRKPRPIPREVVEDVLSALKPRDRAIVLLGMNGGLRPAEILLLQLSDISYGHRKVNVRVSTDPGRRLKAKSADARPVDLRENETLAALSEYVVEVRPQGGPSPYVFLVGGRGKRRHEALSYWAVVKLFARTLDKMHLRTPDRTPHALRHTHATEMLQNGMRDHALMMRLGHSSIRSVQMYASLSDEAVASEYEAAEAKRRKAIGE
jgi:integrase